MCRLTKITLYWHFVEEDDIIFAFGLVADQQKNDLSTSRWSILDNWNLLKLQIRVIVRSM